MTLDAAILAVVVAFLLPLRLATSGHGFNAQGLRRSCATLALTAALFAAIFAVPRNRVRECAAPAVVTDGVSDEGSVQDELRAEVEQLKLQLARLESLGCNNSKVLDDKGDAMEEKDATL